MKRCRAVEASIGRRRFVAAAREPPRAVARLPGAARFVVIIEVIAIHLGELRRAIDAVRYAAGLGPAWSSYDALSGPILASQNKEARQKLDDAVYTLLGRTVSYSGETPAPGGLIRASQLQQIRDGVR